ncbi:hypothetical protein RFI_24084 [Reticulomyxa filosa]|uniref:Uncharacterized protein n=1 Tax=Reticulomyxa filosa TaxID=46433 RepID=X6MIM0_RETFI|nr:hypothetical protein RFI_24084 [Reticulomyxa filosa]|eukprot:ETO13292.1 hypothetical protein RFI_24084 [Reticulomyxa filosa]
MSQSFTKIFSLFSFSFASLQFFSLCFFVLLDSKSHASNLLQTKISNGCLESNIDTESNKDNDREPSMSQTFTSEAAVKDACRSPQKVKRKGSVDPKDKDIIHQMQHIVTNYARKPIDIATISVVCNTSEANIEGLPNNKTLFFSQSQLQLQYCNRALELYDRTKYDRNEK